MTDIFSHILRFHSWLLPKDYNAYPAGSIPSIRRNAIIAACLDVANLMDYIVTRNIKDYQAGGTKIILPDDFVKLVEEE